MNQELFTRYQDNYRAAASAIRTGNGIRAFGALLAAVGIFSGMISASNGCVKCGVWLAGGGLAAGVLFAVAGLVLAIQGRILQSSLDTAVSANSSLSQHEQGSLMTLQV